MKRRSFLKKSAVLATAAVAAPLLSMDQPAGLPLRRLNIWRPVPVGKLVLCDVPYSEAQIGDICQIVPNGSDSDKKFRVLFSD